MELSAEWANAVEALAVRGGRVLVVGPVDVGKSTFCRLLVSAARRAGRSAAVVDADPGQKLIGPPATVTLGLAEPDNLDEPDHLDEPDNLAEPCPENPLRLAGIVFVGAVDALRAPSRIARGVALALVRLEECGGADCVAINTAGIVRAQAQHLMRRVMAAAAPDTIVAIGDVDALAPALDGTRAPLIRLAPSEHARRKSPAARARMRREAFADLFAGAQLLRFGLDAATCAALAEAPERLLVGIEGNAPASDSPALLVGRTSGDGETGRTAEALLLAPTDAPDTGRLVPGFMSLDENFRSIAVPRAEANRQAAFSGKERAPF